MEDTETLARRIGFVRETLYGSMWATAPNLMAQDEQQRQADLLNQQPQNLAGGGSLSSSSSSSSLEEYRDTAYTNCALNLHTDCAYLRDPPGLQIFNCTVARQTGGDSLYVDGFSVADQLRREDPAAFRFFCDVSLPFHCFDSGCHQLQWAPIFTLETIGMNKKENYNRRVVQVRHNDYDRAPLSLGLTADEVDQFYQHQRTLTNIIRDPANVMRLPTVEGLTIICDNHRVLHGRTAFCGERNLAGAYIGQDEWKSQARIHGVL
jgi:trimethyllysine dioxygenase